MGLTSRRNAVRGMIGAVILGLLAFTLLAQFAPDTVAFSPNNYGWDGIQGVASAYGVNFTTTLSGIPSKGVLAIVQPSVNFSSSESRTVKEFLSSGGTVLVADKSGVANSLLRGLGAGITIESPYTISDQTYNWKSKTVPTALVLPGAQSAFPFLSGVKGVALSQPSPLAVSGALATDVAITSQFSTATTLSPSAPGVASSGPFVVMAAQKIGNGTLLVVGDPQFLLNSEWTIANNKVLITNLFAGSNVFIDASHWGGSSTSQLKSGLSQVYSLISTYPNRYLFTLASAVVVLALLPSNVERRPARSSHLLTTEQEV